MARTKESKKEVVGRVTEAVRNAVSVVFVAFHGLPVAQTNAMRKELRKEGVGYFVAKKTLIRRSLTDLGILGDAPELSGEIAIAYGDDVIVPARSVAGFVKKHKDQLMIVGGILGGSFQGKEKMREIAAIPTLPVLYAQVANLLNSPIQGLAIGLNAIAEKRN
ncbi:50S ribosomal protein L10 [Candidatus Kaiserbacteria bacterium RIFCSPHIGHO2_02_FULL_50_9]|uniref:Large ribosomal subunit protein uL10 n=1 Tax=Candidatus Kaiserbacteria bacterium RIFCSPLOWO2_01_FULL_51_21 TaxID=1798508 RepID=A0A1F6ECE0_9BACT|nr:MAG: 50S ribosomal protein L10 [Candidatus Kaiserbacteria bacterium RIFCSPHIGHO2_01_FULL_51_33]OGG63592.1 MAG: 50S ribosomal protein L10 [Candidatus Kaiserbacteria bacterium RIFCSPHIGHO2_02_FULL_50_9]OGG71345.1 MAG: 50S ribosomal protein L10 [Candidatus Kaiserbacteria bacterium RIFCSPLOWO2_01_FULL_51_21]